MTRENRLWRRIPVQNPLYPERAAGGALGGALSSAGIPRDGIPKYETDLRADRFLVIAHGTSEEVARARELLASTNHDRIDHHSEELGVK